jgi:hypothetical protein
MKYDDDVYQEELLLWSADLHRDDKTYTPSGSVF